MQNNLPAVFPFPFGVSEFTTRPWSFERDVERYAGLGVAMIEVCEEKLDEHRYPQQMGAIKDNGLKVCAVQPLVRTFGPSEMQPEPKDLRLRISRLRSSIEKLAPFAQECPFILNTGAPEKGNIQALVDTTIRELRNLAPFAADHGARLALEPLNASSMNSETAIWTISQALEIIHAVNQDNIGLCLDLWNIWQDACVEDEIIRAGNHIFALQVSDWRTPRSASDRLVPGDGIIPIGQLLHTVYKAGYRGTCTVEIFSQDVPDALYAANLEGVIGRSKAGLEKAWAQALY